MWISLVDCWVQCRATDGMVWYGVVWYGMVQLGIMALERKSMMQKSKKIENNQKKKRR
jgi:hypothetical protein